MIPLVGGASGYLDPQFDCQLTVNMYQARMEGTKEIGLIQIPGRRLRYTHPDGESVRAQFADRNDLALFAVFGSDLVSFDESLNPITIGEFENTTSGYIGIDSNNSKQITFVDGVDGYVYDYSTGTPTFEPITSDGFPPSPTDVSYLDGHMLVTEGDSNRWFISDIDDATSYNALNFAQLTSDEEKVVGIRVVNRRIFIFGRYITEVFYNSGNASSFPFVRDNNVVLQYGCGAVKSISQADNKLIWVATQRNGGPSVRLTMGGPAIRISDPAVEYALQSYEDLTDCRGYMQKINAHTFYVLNNPTANECWVCDLDMNYAWHKQEMIDGSTYFASTHAVYLGKHYAGSYNAPEIYEISPDFTTNDDQNIHCVRITAPIFHPKLQRMRHDRFEIQGFMGGGATTTAILQNNRYDDFELDPKIYISVSRDYGKTFSEPFVRSMGKAGEFNWQAIVLQLGVSKSFVYKLETFHANRTAFLRADGVFTPIGY
jgi:hypothetical protein